MKQAKKINKKKKKVISKKRFKQDKFFLLPSIILLKKESYGAVARIKGIMFCFGYWVFQLGFIYLDDEAFVKPINYSKFLEFYKINYSSIISKEDFDNLLRRNNNIRYFFERTNINHFYSKKILSKIVDKTL